MLRLELYRRVDGEVVKWPPVRYENVVGETDEQREADFERRRAHYAQWPMKFALARFEGLERTWL